MTAPTDRRRRDTRERLVRAAIDGFRRRGPAGTGLAVVCAKAGTTKGVLNHHFPGGKEELLLAAIERNAGEVDRILDEVLVRSATVGQATREVFQLYAALLDRDPDFGCPHAAAIVDASSGSDAVRQAIGDTFGRWVAKLADAQQEHGWSEAAAHAFAVTAVAAMEGAILLSRAARRTEALREVGQLLGTLADGCPSSSAR